MPGDNVSVSAESGKCSHDAETKMLHLRFVLPASRLGRPVYRRRCHAGYGCANDA